MSNKKEPLVNRGSLLRDSNWRPRAGLRKELFIGISNGILMYMHEIDVGRITVKSQIVEY